MSAFAKLVWKEWRDHRAPLLAFPLLLPPVIALGVGLLPAGQAREPALPTFALLGCFAIAALTIVADLIPGEEERGTIALLRRLPCGLTRVFLAKLAFAMLGTAACCVLGYVATTVASAALRGGPWFPAIDLLRTDWLKKSQHGGVLVGWWALTFVLGAWILAVSTWLPRGSLALPAAAASLALFAGPVVLTFLGCPGLMPTKRELVVEWWTLIGAAPLVAGVAFVLGRRFGGGRGKSAAIGLIATAIAFVPAYGLTAWRVHEWTLLDPEQDDFVIDPHGRSFLGTSGRYAFLTGRHQDGGLRAPPHALVVDLQDGSWRELGIAGESFQAFGRGDGCVPVPFVERQPENITNEESYARWVLVDTETLATSKMQDEMSVTATPEKLRIAREGASLRLEGGRRVWRRGGELVVESADGSVCALPGSKIEGSNGWMYPAGHGMRIVDNLSRAREDRTRSFYDVQRERRFKVPETFHEVWVRAGRWVVLHGAKDVQHQRASLYDPTTGELSPVPASLKIAAFRTVLEDGRMLAVLRAARDPRLGTVALVDPETGTIEPVELPTWFGEEVRENRFFVVGATPSGALVVQLVPPVPDAAWKCWHARLDVAERRLVVAGDLDRASGSLLGCLDEESLIHVEKGSRIVRARFGESRVEVLFPRFAR